MKREGIDPRVKKRATAQGSKTFKEFAEEQYPVWCQGLSEEELKQWQRSVRDVPSPHDKKLQEITTEHVLEALKEIWTVKPVTASRTRQRIERLMDAAKALRLRTGENPAAWRGKHFAAEIVLLVVSAPISEARAADGLSFLIVDRR